MNSMIRLAAMAVALAVPLAAHAANWQESFEPGSVASYLGAPDATVLLVAGGQVNAELTEATQALAASMREAKRTVLTGEALGPVADLDDAAIARKAAHLPVRTIAVVRVFPGAAGDEPTAMVTLYSKQAEPTNAFAVKRGTALPKVAATGTPSEGASVAAVEAISKLQTAGTGTRADAKEAYEKSVVWFEDWRAVNGYGATVGAWSVPYKGKYKVELSGADFYDEVERPDLAERYRSKNTMRQTFLWTGIAGLIAGPVVMLAPLFGGDDCFDVDPDMGAAYDACDEKNSSSMKTGLVAGGAITGVGTVLMVVGLAINPNPVDPPEARRLADEHNKKLREKLGLPTETATGEGGVSLGMRFSVGRDNAGVVLQGQF